MTSSEGQISFSQARIRQGVLLFPLILFQVYLTVTVALFEFGPLYWPVQNHFTRVIFLIGVQLALAGGYLTALKSRANMSHSRMQVSLLLNLSLLTGVLWAIPTMLIRTTTVRESFGGLLNCIFLGITNPGLVYNEHQHMVALRQSGEAIAGVPSYLWMTDYLLSPLVSLTLPICVLNWRNLSLMHQVGFFFVICAYVASWIAIGTNKGLFDMAMILPWCVLAYRLRTGDTLVSALRKLATIVGILAILVFGYFNIASTSRRTDSGIDPGTMLAGINQKSVVLLLPESVARPVIHLTAYMTQGYYALDLALGEPFVPCWGFGNSYFLAGLTSSIFGRGVILERSYPARIEEGSGWSLWQRWHSFYVWMASDVTFPGVLVVIFFVGRLFCMMWNDVIYGRNIFATALLPLLVLMIFYFPGNNQVLGFGNTAIPFFVSLTGWLWTRLHPVPSVERTE